MVMFIIAVAIGFLVLTTALGSRYAPALFRGVNRYARSPGTLVAVALAFTLLFAEFANAAKLAWGRTMDLFKSNVA